MDLYVKKELYDDIYDAFNKTVKERDAAQAAERRALAAYNRIYAENANTQRAYNDMANINERQKEAIDRLLLRIDSLEKDRSQFVPYTYGEGMGNGGPPFRVTASNPVDDQKIMELSGRLRAICAVIQKRFKSIPDKSDIFQCSQNAILREIANAGKMRINVPATPPVEVTMEDL